jgi:hypothetical protein
MTRAVWEAGFYQPGGQRRGSGSRRSVSDGGSAQAVPPAPPPTDVEVARLVAIIRTRVLRLLRRRGIFTEAADDDAPIPSPRRRSPSPASRVRRSRAAVLWDSQVPKPTGRIPALVRQPRDSGARQHRQVLDDTCQSGGSGFGTMTDPRSVSTHLVTDLSRTLPTPSGRPESAASLLPSARLPAVAPAL